MLRFKFNITTECYGEFYSSVMMWVEWNLIKVNWSDIKVKF